MADQSPASDPANTLHRYVGAFVDGLVAGGVRHVCLCPGSRSTPLGLELWRHPAIQVWVHLDERSCGYFALGLAKARREPVAVICTSGTASANFAPAAAEAASSGVPLLLLTTDRPPELRDVGANQTIDQIKLFGTFSKRFVELALPDPSPPLLRYARHWGQRAATDAIADPPGPVHINLPLREPLLLARPDPSHAAARALTMVGEAGLRTAPRRPEPESLLGLAARLRVIPEGVIICGPQSDPRFPEAVTALAETLGYPILADPLSQVRCGPHDRTLVIDTYDTFLRDATVTAQLRTRAALRFGATPTSKVLLDFLTTIDPDGPHVLITDGRSWNDPALIAQDAIIADATAFCETLLAQVAASAVRTESTWPVLWRRAGAATREAIAGQWDQDSTLSEARVITELAALLPEGATLFAGNSMPVRDVDSVLFQRAQALKVFGNRGVSGIDGVVSTALGVASQSEARLALVIGDLSFYHDSNGLLAARKYGINATVVVINNDGGGIFSFLPQATLSSGDANDEFEALFGTPHGLTFEHTAALYGLDYVCAYTITAFRDAVERSLTQHGTQIIEVRTDRTANVAAHRALWDAAAQQARAAIAPTS